MFIIAYNISYIMNVKKCLEWAKIRWQQIDRGNYRATILRYQRRMLRCAVVIWRLVFAPWSSLFQSVIIASLFLFKVITCISFIKLHTKFSNICKTQNMHGRKLMVSVASFLSPSSRIKLSWVLFMILSLSVT